MFADVRGEKVVGWDLLKARCITESNLETGTENLKRIADIYVGEKCLIGTCQLVVAHLPLKQDQEVRQRIRIKEVLSTADTVG